MKTKEELLEIISRLQPSNIMVMSNAVITGITRDYEEPFVKSLISKGRTNSEQRQLFRVIKAAADAYCYRIGYAVSFNYLNDIQIELECGMVINENGQAEFIDKNKDKANVSPRVKEQGPCNKKLKNDRNEELKSKIDDLEGQLKDMKDALSVYEQGDNIELHDKVRLELLLRFIEENGIELQKRGNKARAARLLQMITELPSSTCRNYMTNRDLNTQTHNEEILKIDTELQALGISVRL